MDDVFWTVGVVCYSGVWLIMQYTLTVRKNFNVWWGFNFSALWPITFALALAGHDFNRYKETREHSTSQ